MNYLIIVAGLVLVGLGIYDETKKKPASKTPADEGLNKLKVTDPPTPTKKDDAPAT